MSDREPIKWITVRGNHVPIFEDSGSGSIPKESQIQNAKADADKLNNEEKNGENYKHAYQLIAKAQKVEPQVTKDLQQVVKNDNAELAGLQFRFKGKNSLADKLERKSLEKNISVEEYAKRVTDVLRYTEQSSEEALYNNFNSFVRQMNERGYEMIEVNNTWYDGSVYKGINTLMRTPDGYVFEMQFHTPTSLEIKEINHKLYEESRKPSTSQSERDRLELEMSRNANNVPTPTNVGKIKNK